MTPGAALPGARARSAPTCWARSTPTSATPTRRTSTTCEECRREYDRLAHLPALLDLAAERPDARGPTGGEERLVASLRAGVAPARGAARALIATGTGLAGAAAAAVAILGFGVGTDDDPPAPDDRARAGQHHRVAADAWATAKLHDRAAGSIVDFEAGGLPWSKSDDRYVVLRRARTARRSREATFTVDADGWAQVAMTSGAEDLPRRAARGAPRRARPAGRAALERLSRQPARKSSRIAVELVGPLQARQVASRRGSTASRPSGDALGQHAARPRP